MFTSMGIKETLSSQIEWDAAICGGYLAKLSSGIGKESAPTKNIKLVGVNAPKTEFTFTEQTALLNNGIAT